MEVPRIGAADRAALATLVALALASLAWLVHPWFDAVNDAALYLLTAKALAAGEGYSYLGENLASWGYTVVSLDQDELMARQDGLGKVATLSIMQIDVFDVYDWPHARFQDGKRLVVRHPIFIVEEAIVGEPLLHAAPSLK